MLVASTTLVGAATLTQYADRTTFNAAAGPLSSEDFNSSVSDVSFNLSTIDVGPFTITHSGFFSFSDFNFIDVPPLDFAGFDIDGTTLMNGGVFSGDSIILTFDSPIFAFGADFSALNDIDPRSFFEIAGETITLPTALGIEVIFFGIISDTAFTTVTLTALVNIGEGYGMDNVAFGDSELPPVPLPAALPLLLGALGGLGALGRWCKRNKARAT